MKNSFRASFLIGLTVLSFPVFAETSALSERVNVSTDLTAGGGHLVVEARGVPPKAPFFFSAEVENLVNLGASEVTGEIKVSLRIVQGRPEVISLGLGGTGEVVAVTGEGVRDWAVRQSGDARFLDVRPRLAEGKPAPATLAFVIRTRIVKPRIPGALAIPILNPGDAVGFVSRITLVPGDGVEARIARVVGMVPLDREAAGEREERFAAGGAGALEVMLAPRGATLADVELVGARLLGHFNAVAGCVNFRLIGEARVREAGARLAILGGRAALAESAAGEGWHVGLSVRGRPELIFERAGNFPIDVRFAAALSEAGGWRRLDFAMPAGAIVPLVLEGLPAGVVFDPAAPVVPDETSRRGFLPAGGQVALGWRQMREAGDGSLFYTSNEQSDVRVGAGLLRQTARLDFRVLQGKLSGVRVRLDGPGEILAVEGASVLSWQVVPGGKQRILEVRLSRPFEKEGSLVVRSQAPLGSFPVRAETLRLTPEGGVRHSGFVRVANDGAVRLEVAEAAGLMQLAPEQFPGEAVEAGTRQVFVYRFPSANYACRIVASQILPEVAVSQITIYEVGDTDRVITADLELDIREAPLREWSLAIPGDYAVVSVNGGAVGDYAAEGRVENGRRTLKILFGGAVQGRQLVQLRLEKSQAAAAGGWSLPPLAFPGAKSMRGHIGVVAVAGFRIVPDGIRDLVEMPLNYFPKQVSGLQQAYRLRDPGWTAAVKVAALGQSVEADVFHLYSLKEGVVYGSVLLNYFVVGAPANEWRIEVPRTVGNIDVTGQNVGRDWRRDGNQVIIPLRRPVLGSATVLVTFEQPMSARGGVVRPGEVRPLGVQGERGYVQVVSPLQVKSRVAEEGGNFLKLEAPELPAEFRLLTSSTSLATYQYTARPFVLAINVEWYAPAETLDQLVDFAKLASRVSRDGQIVTDARYFVKTRGRKALRLTLPAGAKLWEVRADRELVNARADGAQILVPLPPRLNPNEPVEVSVRYGQAAIRADRPVLESPLTQAPTVLSEWTVSGDPGQRLGPRGGTAVLERPNLTESGFEWISARAAAATVLLLLATGLAGWLVRTGSGGRAVLGFLLAAMVVFGAIRFSLAASIDRRVNVEHLAYSAPVVPAGEAVTIQVTNVAAWRAMISGWGVAAGLLGLGVAGAGALRIGWGRRSWAPPLGAALIGAGILAQRGGAIGFFLLLAAAGFFGILLPMAIRWMRRPRVISRPAVTALFVGLAVLGGIPMARAQETAVAEAIVQSWKIRDGRLFGEIEMRVRGRAGDSQLLLRPPAVLTDFQGDGLRIAKVWHRQEVEYHVVLERDGAFAGRARFEMPAGDFRTGLALPTGPAVVQRVTVQLEEGGWEFVSPAAVSVEPLAGLKDGESGATLVLGSGRAPLIQMRARTRDVAAEKVEFYAEAANLFVPGPGVVNGVCGVTIRPARGQVSALEFEIPRGFTVGDVTRGPVAAWRFDPESRRLRVVVEPAQAGTFRFDIETQLGTTALPVDLALEPIRVRGAAGEVGMIGLAFGGDAQPENVRGQSSINLEDFDAGLIPTGKDGKALATLQQVFRYGREGGRVALRVAPVAPEVRVTARQVLSLGDDRIVLSADLQVAITRAGLFTLSFALPPGLEVEAVSGPALGSWTEAGKEGGRVVTIQLNGRTIGEQNFSVTFTGPAPAAQGAWPVPRLSLREATRQTGEIFIVPERGLRLRAVARENVAQLDPAVAEANRPGALAFRLLQENWTLRLGIEALEPWVTVQALQEITVREGQTLTRLSARFRVDNAAVKQARVRLSGLSESQAQTVRGSGPAVSDLVKVGGEADLWEVRFQRGIVGETDVQIEFQGQTAREQGRESILIPIFEGARQVAQFVAVRGSGRIDLEAGDAPRGWQRLDWSAVPGALQSRSDRSVPTLCYRVAEPEGPLAVNIRRHDIAEALRLRVTHGALTTLFSPRGPSLTAVQLTVEVVEKSSLRVRLPKGAQLVSAFVNEESVPVVRENEAFLLTVSPRTDADRTAGVRMVYSEVGGGRGAIDLVGPRLDVPLVNVSWRVVVPASYELRGYRGSLRLAEEASATRFGIAEYLNLASANRASGTRKATALIDQANALLRSGEQQQAGEVLSRAANAFAVDEATNEDARVQLRTLKTQQAVVGLNTRRQRIYLDNKVADAQRNAQLEQAASQNPFMQGRTNFDPRQIDQLLMGNSAEENSALRGIAGRIVEQQLAAEPASGAIDVTIPESGRIFAFTRSIQVDGEEALALRLDVAPTGGANGWLVLALLLLIPLAAGAARPARA